jgi:hypothetical protein
VVWSKVASRVLQRRHHLTLAYLHMTRNPHSQPAVDRQN